MIIYHVIFLHTDQKKVDLICIENISKTKVLGIKNDGEVILEVFEEDKAEQLWQKGKAVEGLGTI